MAWRLSTGFRNELLQATQKVPHAITGITFEYVADGGGAGIDRIIDSDAGFGAYEQEDYITVIGSTGNDGKTGRVVEASADQIDVVGADLVNEAAGTQAIIAAASGGSVAGIFKNGVIRIYSGAQPANADAAETGTLLCEISANSGVFTPGQPDNGITFGQVAGGVLQKAVGEIWSGLNVADGTAGWFRIYANSRVLGASTSAVRLDGACATSGAQMNMSSTSLTSGITTTVDGVELTMPAA